MTGIYRLAVIETDTGRLAVVERNGKLLPISSLLADEITQKLGGSLGDLLPLMQDWPAWSVLLKQHVDTEEGLFASHGISAGQVKFAAPIQNPGKIVCIGANYHDHIAEMSIPIVPEYPYSFIKPANNTVRGNGDPVAVPKRSKMMDWEAELGVVIGRQCFEVSAKDALDTIAGYINFNDLSARDWIASRPPVGIDWVQHKAFDGFAPMGPYFVPAHFIPDPQNLPVRLKVNGETRQNSSTAQMVFGVADIIAHLTSIMTLYPGDIIATGTPAGVGHGMKPPQYLKGGDVVEMEIGPLGQLVTPII